MSLIEQLTSGIVVGTHNRKKLVEMRDLLEPLGITLQSLAETPGALEVEETGTTFIENARLKAATQARHLGRWTIGEDSGLCVPALGVSRVCIRRATRGQEPPMRATIASCSSA